VQLIGAILDFYLFFLCFKKVGTLYALFIMYHSVNY